MTRFELLFPEQRELRLKEVLEYTKNVVNWNLLGIQLGIEPCKIRMIELQHERNLEQGKMEMFDHWLRSSEKPTWEKLVEALEHRRYTSVARLIRDKIGLQGAYHACFPKSLK